MKKIIILIFVFTSMSIYGQGLYFDGGVGAGFGWTTINGRNVVDTYKSSGYGIDTNFAFEVGFKGGYGPFGDIPLYAVGELAWVLHGIDASTGSNHIGSVTKPIIFGAGVIFYPIPLIQVGTSFCCAYSGWIGDNKIFAPVIDLSKLDLLDRDGQSQFGFAWNISLAVDLGSKSNGILIGVKYWYENISRSESVNTHMLGIFVRYAFRQKAPSLF